MKESLLKKEFKQSDVQRVRNLVNKDFTGKTIKGIGYKKTQEVRNEGDTWEEDGRTWTIKNGLKQNITKLDSVKQYLKVPLTCPKCSTSMNYHLHKKMFKIHGFCFDCTIEYESYLRKIGKYKEYEESMIKGGIKSFTKDLEQWVKDTMEESSNFVTEDGDIEEWKNNINPQKEKTLKELNQFIEKINNSL